MVELSNLTTRASPGDDHTTQSYYHHTSGQRVFTHAVLVEALSKQYPGLHIIVVPKNGCDLLSYAGAGFAEFRPLTESATCPLTKRFYATPARRMDADHGNIVDTIQFGKFEYQYKGSSFVLYAADGRDGAGSYPQLDYQFLVLETDNAANELIKQATTYMQELHNEIWVFDGGYWHKSADLYRSVDKASWDDVILDDQMKHDIQTDVLRFYESREKYDKLRVPWKRGIIYYGPPGNGKTVSIKAMMHSLYHLKAPVPTLYVRSLNSFAGPEYSIQQIFAKARQQAPCLLVFEDLDSLVRDDSRTYFLNEVDGLQVNEGVLMIGSTNYLERLDPGISKRPSRFDRKYEFPKPSLDQRIQYSEYWRDKLSDNKEIEFPKQLCRLIAIQTDNFSFAYMQEAFVATLLVLASRDDAAPVMDGKVERSENFNPNLYTVVYKSGDLEKLPFWREMQKQIKILRDEL